MEEKFFFHYYLKMNRSDFLSMPIHERKWLIDRYINQRKKENELIEAERRKHK